MSSRNNVTRYLSHIVRYLYICVPVYQYIKYINKNKGLALVHRPVHTGTHWPKTVHIGPAEALS
jgi:hypothetical protein